MTYHDSNSSTVGSFNPCSIVYLLQVVTLKNFILPTERIYVFCTTSEQRVVLTWRVLSRRSFFVQETMGVYCEVVTSASSSSHLFLFFSSSGQSVWECGWQSGIGPCFPTNTWVSSSQQHYTNSPHKIPLTCIPPTLYNLNNRQIKYISLLLSHCIRRHKNNVNI